MAYGFTSGGRRMTISYGDHVSRMRTLSYVRMDEKDSITVGVFVMVLGFQLFLLAFAAQSALSGGQLPMPVPSHADELVWVIVVSCIVCFVSLFFSWRLALALILMIVGVVVTTEVASELLTTRSHQMLALMLAAWPVATALGFALMYPYPWWQGLVIAWAASTAVEVNLLMSWLMPEPDQLVIGAVWVVAFFVFLFGVLLRGMANAQREDEDRIWVRYANDAGD